MRRVAIVEFHDAPGTPMNRHPFPSASRIVHALVLLFLFLPSPGSASQDAHAGSAALQAEVARPGSRTAAGQDMVARLYEAQGYRPIWTGGDGRHARQALRLLREAHAHGLDPSAYRLEALSGQLNNPTEHGAERVDIALSRAVLQLLADLHFGRVAPDISAIPAAVQGPAFDPVEQLRHALRHDRVMQLAYDAAPRIPLYWRVRATLAEYRALAQLPGQWLPIPALPHKGKLIVGQASASIPLVRKRLMLLGDLPDGVATAGDAVYSADLAQAIRRFQSRHGLDENGELGAATLAALAVPPAQRVRQLILTLERLRWLPAMRRGRIVVVNLPAYRLWAFDTAGPGTAEPLEMRVIVGAAARTPTPVFVGQMRYLEFNPYWNVPRSIEQAEIIPKLARDPAYLRNNAMELVSASGQVLQPGQAASLAALRAATARVRQRPGAHNVLGAVKFAMPNPMNIYLHSTSARELFSKERRDLSHGCIRVERPAELAEFVLADPSRWDRERVRAAMQPGPTRAVRLGEAIPVVLFYATAVTDRRGRALFANDIYRRDPKLAQALHLR
ncbi:L,D-transpeptidase family protein [Massilia scottii]|uniref:L,D-transpeptidase family protein n=1 Tax=Massilia scottii TaxID=3057166 RepID=UPI0027968FF7|nr:L,D-transpeptidase family protein [Massilia sp. CCM 9029]MDQ1831642.1 L,D-transpeptidase family protein [Massilia sp. CCM 9029]